MFPVVDVSLHACNTSRHLYCVSLLSCALHLDYITPTVRISTEPKVRLIDRMRGLANCFPAFFRIQSRARLLR